jgi:hypothetical protein
MVIFTLETASREKSLRLAFIADSGILYLNKEKEGGLEGGKYITDSGILYLNMGKEGGLEGGKYITV